MGQPPGFLNWADLPGGYRRPVVEISEFSGVFYAHSDFAPPLGEEIA